LVTVVSAWTLQRDASNGLTSVLEMSYDITERKQAENQLRLVARRLKLATQALQAGVWELDLSTNLVDWDEKMYSIYGLPRDRRITYQTWADAVLPQDLPEAEAILQRALVSKTEIATEFRILHPDGSVRHIQAAHGVMLNDAAQVTRMVGVNIDITDQRRTDATLLEARHLLELRFAELAEINRQLALKNEEVEAFVYIVSHDLRAPLVNLKGFCKELELSCHELRQELIVAGADEDRVQTILNVDIPDSLHYINASTSTFHRLINSLLELSRYGRQEYNSEELDLNHLVQSTLDLLRLSIAAAGAQVSLGPIPKVYGDATAIGQVFANLIGNAVKYLQPGRPGLIVIGGELANGMAHCWVKDNGAGLPSSAKPRLFQVFQRFHPELAQGEGMGLAIVRRVVERHGGRIWAEGEEDGVGTAFHFTLPSGPRI
jgi:PAS domain S-box-containing protein